MSGNDAEELLPVTAFEKVIKTTIRQAASPVTRQDMWEAYKAAIPGATVTVSPEGAMPWEENLNRSRAKSKYPWAIEGGVVKGGLIKRVSPAMIHTYFEYMTSEYPRSGVGHDECSGRQ